ncbi:hypothetical protein TIFTF001_024788 [Ficus carica]|uniref:Uncharacterized protein n=1 Tax=Ficus carica TaxID=3494 RepID=A0AA88ANX4_FICCA|nr:hypothetical protein TIFTF001_024788 [Ficus carica]
MPELPRPTISHCFLGSGGGATSAGSMGADLEIGDSGEEEEGEELRSQQRRRFSQPTAAMGDSELADGGSDDEDLPRWRQGSPVVLSLRNFATS